MFPQQKLEVCGDTQVVHAELGEAEPWGAGVPGSEASRPWFPPQGDDWPVFCWRSMRYPCLMSPPPPHPYGEPWDQSLGWGTGDRRSRQHNGRGGKGKGRHLQPEPDPEYRSSSSSSGKESSSPEPSRSTGLSKFSLRQR